MFFPLVQAYLIIAHSRYGINAKRRDGFRPLVPLATWASLGALLTAVERAGATPEAPQSSRIQWEVNGMFGWTYKHIQQ